MIDYVLNDYLKLKIFDVRKAGGLEDGACYDWNWYRRRGKSSVRVTCMGDMLSIDYNTKKRYETEQTPYSYKVKIVRTPCNYGGGRPWFVCPSCSKRIGVLYIYQVTACRNCLGKNYYTQNQPKSERIYTKMNRLRDKLGWEAGILNSKEVWNKPKHMHWKTFARLVAEYEELEAQALPAMMEKFKVSRI